MFLGQSKGVMLSHDNLIFVSKNGCEFEKMEAAGETIISYLPLSHIAAQIVDIYASLFTAGTTYFAERDALKGSLAKTLKDVRPTRFLGVPRVYEKMHEKMVEIGSRQNCLMRCIGSWAKRVTLQHHLDIMAGKPGNSFQYKVAKKFIISKVKQALGFDQCRTFASGAASMNLETQKYFLSLDIPIIQIFGMSESSGGHSFSTVNSPFECIGKGLPGTFTKIRNPDSNGHGEMLVKGRHVFMGYLNEIDKTDETILENGWMATGDIACIDHEGYIYITGRLKELIITAGGENVPPNHIEQLVKSELPAISNAFLIGDRRKYLTILITLKTLMDSKTGMPQDELAIETLKWVEGLGLHYKTLSSILEAGPDPKIVEAIQEAINKANKKAISNAQRVQKFKILDHDFSIVTGEYGDTMKVKRHVVVEKFKDVIESMYQ
jgi:long-chain-fatty-acid--CoA ligase ACSBG